VYLVKPQFKLAEGSSPRSVIHRRNPQTGAYEIINFAVVAGGCARLDALTDQGPKVFEFLLELGRSKIYLEALLAGLEL
jgi:hypothetical protein